MSALTESEKRLRMDINIRPFRPFDRATRDLLEAEAEDIGRFFELQAALAWR